MCENNKSFNVVYITDEKYAMPTCASMVSLKENTKNEVVVHVICYETLTESINKFLSLEDDKFHVNIVEPEKMNQAFSRAAEETIEKMGTYVSKSALFKFDIPQVLSDIEVVLYLDGDVIINKDLSELFKTDIKGYYVAAVDDMGDGRFWNEEFRPKLSERINLHTESYFNSGVMLLNLKKMREDDLFFKLKDYRLNGINYFMDQDSLNYVLGTRRKKLSFCYNFRMALIYQEEFEDYNRLFYDNKYVSIEDCISDQAIIHMTDSYKPWDYNIIYVTETFYRYLEMSPYKDVHIPFKTLSQVFFEQKQSINKELEIIYKKYGELSLEYNYAIKCKSIMEWRFPTDRINKDSQVVLYGAGEIGKAFINKMQKDNYCKIVLWVDGNYEKINNLEVCNPDRICYTDYDKVLVAVSPENDIECIVNKLKKIGVNDDKIVTLL